MAHNKRDAGYLLPESSIAIPPGATLREWLDENDMSQAELARRTNLTAKHLNQLVHGIVPLSADVAQRLEMVTRIPSRMWTRLEADYRSIQTADRARAEYAEHISWLKSMPVAELVTLGRLPAVPDDAASRVEQLLRFFGVSSVDAWQNLRASTAVSFRQSTAFAIDANAVAVWLRIGELDAEPADQLPAYDADGLRSLLPRLRSLSREPIRDGIQQAVCELGRVGVRLVIVPEIKGARSFGATRWISGRPLVQVSIRGKTVDRLWATVFHETAHVLLHDRRTTFVDEGDEDAPGGNDVEVQADQFAFEHLVPASDDELDAVASTKDAIELADRIHVDTGVIVALLQRQGRWGFDKGGELRRRVDDLAIPGAALPPIAQVRPERLRWGTPGDDE